MFKSPFLRSTLLHARRAPFRRTIVFRRPYSLQSQPETQIQSRPVQISRRRYPLRRAVTWALYAGCFWVWLEYVLPAVLPPVDDEEDEEEDEEELDEEELERRQRKLEEEAIFIPMTWATPRKREFYKGTDPEWQEFMKLSRDKQRIKDIQKELVGLVGGMVGGNQHLVMHLGKDAQVIKYWLDIEFPPGPPIEYERTGIEITDDYIAWSTRTVPQMAHKRLDRVLFTGPVAYMKSVYAFYQTLFAFELREIRRQFGFGSSPPLLPPHSRSGEGENPSSGNSGKAGGAPSFDELRKIARQAGITPPSAHSGRSASSSPSSNPLGPPSSDGQSEAPMQGLGIKWLLATTAFKSTLSKNWKPIALEAPRGTCIISGLIEVKGQTGRCLIDVHGAYDPKQMRYVAVQSKMRKYWPHFQSPRGGP